MGTGRTASVARGSKYLVPVDENARLPIVFFDTNWYRIHFCFLSEGFASVFGPIDYEDYKNIVVDKARREFYGGTITVLNLGDGSEPRYTFTLETFPEPDELVTQDEIYDVYRQLQDRFDIGPLSYLAHKPLHVQQAESWTESLVPVTLLPAEADFAYEAYTPGLAYGRVRSFTDAEFFAAGPAAFGWQDILVFDQPPVYLEGVMAASVTDARQDVLTHLNVLSALRGTPNMRVADALEVFASLEGRLVRLESREDWYSVREVSAAEAEAHWAMQRPRAQLNAPPDRGFEEMTGLDDIPTDNRPARQAAVSRFGSKATSLGVLRQHIDPSRVTEGLAIPMGAYFRFMDENRWDAPVDAGTRDASYAETLTAWLADDAFGSDAKLRAQRLEALRTEMVEAGVVAPETLDAVKTAVVGLMGRPDVMMRFRSSSNAEDSLSFNGAGLYHSASGCVPDTAGNATSHCDAERGPKPIDTAIKTVWASLWSFGAFEEREYYQLDHGEVGMAILVNPRFADELANGVAFTGNPADPEDDRFTINVQVGEAPVVSPAPGVIAELDRVRVKDGKVLSIAREASSTLLPDGERVLDDAEVTELAELLVAVAEAYPRDVRTPAGVKILLDMEFKLTPDGFIIKQIRPFSAQGYDPGEGRCD